MKPENLSGAGGVLREPGLIWHAKSF